MPHERVPNMKICHSPAFLPPLPCCSLRNSFRSPLLTTSHHQTRIFTSRRSRLPPCSELTQNDTAEKSAQRMSKTIDSVQSAFNTIRTGRASPSILDRVMVSYYGAETPLNQLASISTNGTSTLVVEPYDKSSIADVERGLMESDIGITPTNDGACIRLTVPPLTEERRKQLVKQVKAMAEDGRVALRNIRRDAVDKLKKLEKKKELSEDESKTLQNDIQKLTDKNVKEIESLLKKKEADIMKV